MSAQRRRQTWWVVAAVAILALVAGCGMFRGGTDEPAAAPVAVADSAPASEEATAAEPEIEPTTRPPAPPTTSKTAKPKPKKPAATPTEDPNNFTEPECATHEGKNVSKAKARSALTAAAGKTYWPTSAPKLKVPARLVLATAWHESGWQSNIVNCDGGRGLMQVMPDTEAFVNQRFGQSLDAHDYRQNAVLGANYLAWLTKYLGDRYFDGSYSLSTGKCRSHASRCLLNMVIAGYNTGHGAVDAAYADKRLSNPGYVDSVRSLMKSCYCDRF